MAEPKTPESSPSNSPPTPPRIRNGNGNGIGHGNGNGNANSNGYFSNHTNGHPIPPPLYTARPSPSTPRRSLNHSTKILGSIDENGGMSPDIPIRNPGRSPLNRTSNNSTSPYNPRAFLTSLFPSSISAPRNDLNDVTGPKGEKFSDVRENKKSYSGGSSDEGSVGMRRRKRNVLRRGGWRTWACAAMVLVIIGTLVAIGLVVGLKRMHQGQRNDNSNTTDSDPQSANPPLTSFPVGAYTFTTFLLSTLPSCTPVPSTWRCYPYVSYTPTSPASSITSLDWVITGSNATGRPVYTISSTDNIFTLPFTDAALTLQERGTEDEHYAFSTIIEKVVYPDEPITTDGAAARCYYPDSTISAKLFTKRMTNLPGNTTVSAQEKPESEWPGALEIWQTAGEAPVCYEMVNGGDGAVVVLQGAVTEGDCRCEYRDFEE